MEETIFIKHLIEKELVNYNLNDEIKSKIIKICTTSYIKGEQEGRHNEQMEFIKQANFQLGIIKQLKQFLIENKNFKVLHYLERLEKERR